MRAYGILPELDRLDALRLVRNSIPAVATSTAAAAGLVCIELYKIALKLNICSGRIPSQLDSKQLESLSNHFAQNHCNTGANQYRRESVTVNPSLEMSYKRLGSVHWTAWDVWFIDGSPTVADVINFLQTKGVDPLQIQGVSMFTT
jgi:hypothetical protein